MKGEEYDMRWDKNLLFKIPEVCLERAKLVTESYKETEGLPAVMRVAKAFKKILGEMTIYIEPNYIIVGNLCSSPIATPIWPEFGVIWLEKELDNLDKRPYDKFIVKEKVKKGLKNVISYWKGKGREEIIVERTFEVLPEEAKRAWDPEAYGIKPVIYAGYRKTSGGSGHTVLNYEKALKIGFKGIIKEAEEALSQIDFSDRDAMKKVFFLKAVIISCNAVINFAKRYANLANELALKEKILERKKELEKIRDICNWIPENPARSYWEALQAIWFMQLSRWVESNGHAPAVGRLDQLLFPYYKKDIEEGRLRRGEALELMENFFVKVFEVKKIRPWSETLYKSGYPTFQEITIGGQNPEGKDVTNELSYLILEATERLKLPEPIVICRVHSKTPDEFLVRSVETLTKHKGGLPAFFSDETIIPAMLKVGIPLNEARDYAMMACSEPGVPGKHIDQYGSDCYFNLAKVLELALNGGIDPESGIGLSPIDKDLSTFNSFNEVLEAYKKQLRYFVGFVPLFTAVSSSLDPELNPTPFVSSLLDYRIEMGKDMTEGGGPSKDNNTSVQGHGIPNVANSLAAIKKLIFEEKRISGKELKEALLTNLEGTRGEEIRKMLLKAPKYGNNDDYVDLIAANLAKLFAEEVKGCGTPWRGGTYETTFQGLTANVPEGLATGATPDGRKAGEALADNISPSAGTDTKGITAMLHSIAKIDHSSYLFGDILNVKFHPTALKGEGISKLAALIRTYLTDLKGWQIQFNVVSAEQLREAQKKPEEYRDLVVKVAGYSAQFISLDKKLQGQILLRTENVI